MAATFGTMLGDPHLRRMGVVNELSGLLVCMLLSFLVGLFVGNIDRPWPMEQMAESQCVVSLLCHGHLRSLWVNVAIAVLSGAAIAISLMRGNTGSLVGVAISASLMPPAVNAVSRVPSRHVDRCQRSKKCLTTSMHFKNCLTHYRPHCNFLRYHFQPFSLNLVLPSVVKPSGAIAKRSTRHLT